MWVTIGLRSNVKYHYQAYRLLGFDARQVILLIRLHTHNLAKSITSLALFVNTDEKFYITISNRISKVWFIAPPSKAPSRKGDLVIIFKIGLDDLSWCIIFLERRFLVVLLIRLIFVRTLSCSAKSRPCRWFSFSLLQPGLVHSAILVVTIRFVIVVTITKVWITFICLDSSLPLL